MDIFRYMEEFDYEELHFVQDKNSGLKAIIAIHDTTLGPALGEQECGHTPQKKQPLLMP